MVKPLDIEKISAHGNPCMTSLLRMLSVYGMFIRSEIKKRSDINGNRAAMLMLLHSEGDGLSQNQIAEELCVKPSSVASMLANMEKDGDIVRSSDEKDKRIKRIYLTPSGKKIADSTLRYMIDLSEKFFLNFSEHEKEDFIRLTSKLEENVASSLSDEAERENKEK